MPLRRPFIAPLATLLLLLLGTCSASASAANGGATPGLLTLPGPPPVVVHIGNPVESAGANGVSISVRTAAMLQGMVHVTGTAPPRTAGGVRIERLDAQLGWVAVALATISPAGTFDALWRADHVGPVELRAVAGGKGANGAAGSANAAAATPQVDVTVYRRGLASWYGPVGVTTACGVVLRRGTLGVAHRSLPCGTPVALYYRGRTLVVPVIDRGPYVHGRTWDLTRATYRALGGRHEGLLTLGALAHPATAVRARG